jgi:hypothetical protein
MYTPDLSPSTATQKTTGKLQRLCKIPEPLYQPALCRLAAKFKWTSAKNRTSSTADYFAAAFFLPPPFAFLTTPPRTMQKRSFRAATSSGVILHTCFLAARRSNSRRETISDAANERDYKIR